MESLFFNAPLQRSKARTLFQKEENYLRKVDISNGIFFYDASLTHIPQAIHIKNLDRMIIISVVIKGGLRIANHVDESEQHIKEGSISLFASSRQNISFHIDATENNQVFILFIADFFLKRYLDTNTHEPINFLYQKTQKEISLERINLQRLDALSLYLIDIIRHTKENEQMYSVRCEHRVMELMIHRFGLLEHVNNLIPKEEQAIATQAKEILLSRFATPPRIEELARLCATNESKLKSVFKKVYKSTLYQYVQKLRLEEANLLLRNQGLSIGEVAKTVGYKHQGHFSKLFFETYGVYPKQLLKK